MDATVPAKLGEVSLYQLNLHLHLTLLFSDELLVRSPLEIIGYKLSLSFSLLLLSFFPLAIHQGEFDILFTPRIASRLCNQPE